METEAERSGDISRDDTVRILHGFSIQADQLWQVLAAITSYTSGTLPLFRPVIRQSLCYLGIICGPRMSRTQVDEARFALVVSLLIAQFTWHILDDACLMQPPYTVVFLPAFTAENQREQHMFLRRPRFELLSSDRQITLLFWFQSGINGVAPTDKLMQTKRERREASIRIGSAGISCQ